MHHPLILTYSETTNHTFPLIMVVGREPNNSTTSDNTLGFYDFKQHPRCAFWNVAFGLLGRVNGLATPSIKELFSKRKSAPIIFTDALKEGISNSVVDKFAIRERTPHAEFNQQVENIFSHKGVISRTKLIVLSGLSNGKVYGSFNQSLYERAAEAGIRTVSLPFFYPTNTQKIHLQLNEDVVSILQDVFKEFELSTN